MPYFDSKENKWLLTNEEFIEGLKKLAESEGYSDLRLYFAEIIPNFDKEAYISALYDGFLEAVNLGDEDPFTGEKWDVNSTFEDFLRATERMINFRIERIREEKRSVRPSFPQLAEEAYKIEGFDPAIKGLGETPPIVVLEAFEELLFKCKEAIESLKRGEIRIPPRKFPNIEVTSWIPPEALKKEDSENSKGGSENDRQQET